MNADELNGTAMIAREEFSGRQLATQNETASTAVAAQAQAATNARFTMAMHRPRDIDQARLSLLKECKRPGFAELAIFSKPVAGRKIEGPSIRFAEAAARAMTNILIETPVIYDDATKRIIRVIGTDLEANLSSSIDVVIEKTVERTQPKEGEQPLSVRVNSAGRKTYLLEASEDQLLVKQAALAAKARRNVILQLVPRDIVDEAIAQARETMRTRDAADPDAARKRLADAFASVGVQPPDLKTFLGHDLASCSPGEVGELRAIYACIRDGEASWKEIIDNRSKAEEQKGPSALTEKIQARAAAAKAKRTPVPEPEPAANSPEDFDDREPGQDG